FGSAGDSRSEVEGRVCTTAGVAMPPRADWAALSRRLRRRSARERGWGLSRCVRSIRRTRTCGWACKLAELARRCPILETDAADSLAAESLALAGLADVAQLCRAPHPSGRGARGVGGGVGFGY